MFDQFRKKVQQLYPGQKQVYLHEPDLGEHEKSAVVEAIDINFVSSIGPHVDQFEQKIAEYTGAQAVVSVVNGTSGLMVAFRVAGVEEGDEVITQGLSFVATANAISHAGATPVFLDINRNTLSLDANSLKAFLKQCRVASDGRVYNTLSGKRIAAVCPVNLFGYPGDIGDIVKICNEYSIPLVEDVAEGLGSRVSGQHVGTTARFGVLSFNGNKVITTGGGGAVLCSDTEDAKKLKHLITTAKVKHPWKFEHDQLGYNLRLPALNAALGCGQMDRLDSILGKKRELSLIYDNFFKNFPEVKFLSEPNGSDYNYWLNTLEFPSEVKRDEFLRRSVEAGIHCRPPWEILADLQMYQNCYQGSLETCHFVQSHFLNLPSGIRGLQI